MKKIVMGITGGIAAYKIPELIRRFLDAGNEIKVIATDTALQFVSKLTLDTLLPNKVFTQLIEPDMQHIQLAKWADVILIAPATAHTIAKLAAGFADDLLTATCLASNASIVVAPAMNQAMWKNKTTQDNIALLKTRGVTMLGPDSGAQACGDTGPGRMCEPQAILDYFASKLPLSGLKILITAGATREAIDPVRFISNRSSGKMGYAISDCANRWGAQVTLISGITSIPPPDCYQNIRVENTKAMKESVLANVTDVDIFISVAAVSDYTVQQAPQKLKRQSHHLLLELVPTEDIVGLVCQLPNKPLVVGFSAETEHVLENAKAKKLKKGLDVMIANDVSQKDIGFDADDNAVNIIFDDEIIYCEKEAKDTIAEKILVALKAKYVDKLCC